MVALSNRFKAWNVLAIGLNVLRLWSCRLLLSDPCLCQGSPVHLTFIMQENICTYLKKIHRYRRYWKSIYSGRLRNGWVCRGCLQMHIFFLRKTKHFLVHVHQSLTWILLVLERLHPLLLAQRPLRPGLSSLVPHHSLLDSHLKHPGQLELDFYLEP